MDEQTEEKKSTFNPLDHVRPKIYTLYIGLVENDANEGEEPIYEDIGEHRTITVRADCMEDIYGKLDMILKEGEYFLGAVLIAVLEHSFTSRDKHLNQL